MQQSKKCTTLHLFCSQLGFSPFGGNNEFQWCVGCIINAHTYIPTGTQARLQPKEFALIHATNSIFVTNKNAAETSVRRRRRHTAGMLSENMQQTLRCVRSCTDQRRGAAMQTTHAK